MEHEDLTDRTGDEPSAPPTAWTPPTTSGDLELLEPPERWPGVVGVLGIIFGSLGILGGFCGVFGPLLSNFFVNIVPAEQKAQIAAQMRYSMPYPILQASIQLVEVVLAIVLLVGSIQVLRRSRGGPKILTTFAWLDLVSNFIGAGIGMLVVQAQADMLKADPDLLKGTRAMPPGAGMAMVIGFFLLAGVWPVFLILWFGREKIRDAVDRWGAYPPEDEPV